MSRIRPSIPVDISLAVLVEAGHRCAVCGVSCPLERAHIVPWRVCREHLAENLICLCANCHERADKESWGEKTLREYKARPWVLRQNGHEAPSPSRVRVRITINKEFEKFDACQENLIRHALANLLRLDPSEIKILAKERGSIVLIMEMPESAANELIAKFRGREINAYILGFLAIKDIFLEQEKATTGIMSESQIPLRVKTPRNFYCPSCSTFVDELPTCPQCGSSKLLRLCRTGHPNPLDGRFCGTCGTPL